jgi:OOP family OmpA-OmpF porin
MKSKAVLAVSGFLAAFALSLPALAQKSDGTYYAGITLGRSNSLNFCNGLGPTCLDIRETWKLLGGYRINRYLAVEAGYHFLGEAKDEDPAAPQNARSKAAELVAVLSYPMGGKLSVYGQAGAYRGNIKGSDSTGMTFNQSKTGVTYGSGLQWDYFAPVSLRGGWQVYRRMGGGTAGPETSIMAWGVSAIYNFE